MTANWSSKHFDNVKQLVSGALVCVYQVIPSHGNAQMRLTLFDGYLYKYCSVKYKTFHQVSEKTSQQAYSHQKTTWKAFQMPPRAIKDELTGPIELSSGSFLIGRRDILVIPRNRLVCAWIFCRWSGSFTFIIGILIRQLLLRKWNSTKVISNVLLFGSSYREKTFSKISLEACL